nr:ribosomal protein L2 [Hydnora abyssinica]WJM99150.1 ribosomal protein L2 [Hydnora abyssinica]WJM99167.1 ribosomal protein L2 [Hydnora abyssinica]WJM99184.1 ribosomal protein L2 [Hydnora abyssinica]WJM99201.1 ribosomal protein L2 [Hydnora abyssinica]
MNQVNKINLKTITKNLICKHKFKKGRNSTGRITMRHRGGGHKHLYRKINFKYFKKELTGKILTIEYDPNRNANICLVHLQNNEYKYFLYAAGNKIGNIIKYNSKKFDPINPIMGSTFPLICLPLGTQIHNIEFIPNKGGQIARAAGTMAKLITKTYKTAILKLPSGKIKNLSLKCFATLGQIANIKQKKIFKKAGEKRWLGKRPIVRGLAMNPIDHPHGGGEGKTSIGRKHPLTPWGYPVFGKKKKKKI